MNRRLLIGLTLIATLNTSSFAMEIYKGKLINHREWTTDSKAKIEIKDLKATLNNFPLKPDSKDFALLKLDQIIAANNMYEANGTVGSTTNLQGNGFALIRNFSAPAHTYTIETEICTTFDTTKATICGNTSDEITLEAQGYVILSRSPVLSMTYNTPGTYSTHAETYITRDDSTTLFSSFSKNQVEIFDVQGAQ